MVKEISISEKRKLKIIELLKDIQGDAQCINEFFNILIKNDSEIRNAIILDEIKEPITEDKIIERLFIKVEKKAWIFIKSKHSPVEITPIFNELIKSQIMVLNFFHVMRKSLENT